MFSKAVISLGICVGLGLLVGCGGGTAQTAPENPGSVQLTVQPSGNGSGTVTSTPAGISCGSTCTASFSSGTQVTLTATPSANSSFGGWSGACSGTSACTLALKSSTSVTANFSTSPTLSVTVQGSGTVSSTPAGINCGSTCIADFASGTQVSLTATPAAGYVFSGWSGACSGTAACTVTVSDNASVTATFSANAALTVTVTGNGTVTSSPTGISCPSTCTASFTPNAQVTLTATPQAGYVFGSWSGACTGTTTTCTVTLSAATSVTAVFGGTLQTSINHIIFMAQENRSFDHYFGYLRQYWANNGYPDQSIDGLPQFNPPAGSQPAPAIPGCNASDPPPDACSPDPTNLITSYPLQTECLENPSPSWNESHVDWDYADPTGFDPPELNGFVETAANDARQNVPPFMDTDGLRAMGYYEDTDLNFYYYMATNFATSDRWFSPVMSRTQLNRMYLMAGTSVGHAYPIGSDNPYDQGQLSVPPIFEALQNAGITWKIYIYPDPEANGNCPANSTTPQCLFNVSYINMFTYGNTIVNSPTLSQNLVPLSQFATDAANGTLPQVAWIEPPSDAGLDEHPSDSDSQPYNIQSGAAYVESLMTALMQSPSWKDSAMLFTYDEFGGFYDHVAPQPAVSPDGIPPMDLEAGDWCTTGKGNGGPLCDFTWTGYRIPLIVVSPFTKKNYVSHTVADSTAVLKFIETRFTLPALTARDAAQPDMTEFFDFVNVPWATPPSPPQQNTNGACTLTPP